MRINVSLDDGFMKWYNNQNQDLLAIDGISNDDLDIQKRSDIYLESSNTANIAIDENANNDGLIKSPNDHYNQMFAGLRKLKNYNSLWTQMKIMYGAERAIELMNLVVNGDLYIHDSSQMNVPYCFSYSSSRIMSEGIYWTDNINIDPPKHHDSFVSQVAEVTIEMSNEFAGAIAIADFLVNYAWYSNKENLDDSVIKQDFQQFVYTINRKYRSHQPPFVNLSLFDRNNIKALFENYKYPDFTSPMDIIDEVMKVQRIFGEWFVKGDSKGRPFRFPVVTASMLEDKDAGIAPDEEFLNTICEQTYDNGAFNIFNSDNIGRIASCCRLLNDFKLFSGVDSFGNGGLNIGCYDDQTEVLTDQGWKFFKDLNKTENICTMNLETEKIEYQKPTDYIDAPYDGEMHHYENKFIDLMVTPNHNMVATSRKTGKHQLIQSQDLKTGYNLPRLGIKYDIESDEIIKIGELLINKILFMKFLGAYLGDGFINHDENQAKLRAYEIVFSFKKDRKAEYIGDLLDYLNEELNLTINKYFNKNNGYYIYKIYSKDLYEYLLPLGKAKNKHIPREILNNSSIKQYEALLDGLLNTDGCVGNNGIWYYTASKQLKDDVSELIIKLGYTVRIFERNRTITLDDREIESHCYEIKMHIGTKEIHKYGKYCNITHYKGNIYCVTVPNHTMMVRRNNKIAWSGNSHRVVTVNLPRVGYLANGDTEEFESRLKYLLESAKNILMAHRKLIKKRADQGSLKFIKPLNYVDVDKMLFSTIGVVGVFEAARNMGYEYDNNGKQDHAIEFMKDIIQLMRNETDKYIDQYGVGFNLEQVPAESLANKFVKKDKILYGEIEIDDILYSNQFIPLTYDMNIYDRMKIDGIFSKVLSGGGITHINLSDKLKSPDQMKKLINFAKECGLEHFAIESMISECENNHHTIGNYEYCPECEAPVIEHYVRVVGYRVPVSSINKIRRKFDIPNRKYKSDKN